MKEHSRLYWILYNFAGNAIVSCKKRKRSLGILVLAALVLAIDFRAMWQPSLLKLRIYSFELIMFLLLAVAFVRFRNRLGWRSRSLAGVAIFALLLNNLYLHWSPHQYLTLYLQYRMLNIQELDRLPQTDHERIQPLHSIRVLAKEAMTEVQQTSDPYFVRIGDQYRWTMSVEPSFVLPRLFGQVKEVISVSATSPSPNFSQENRYPVLFSVGEKLLLGKRAGTAVIKTFGLMRFFSYQPADVKYVEDDKGDWVELVSLIRWRGIFFPRPEFGGVQVIHQIQKGLLYDLKLMFLGEGHWIKPKDIAKYPYLKGQNLIPYSVGRYAAQSFRFQNGFFAPFPGFHRGDVRIPDLQSDINDQPFITFFLFEEGGGESKLYLYFALEPYERTRQGLNTSILFPADSIGPVRVYYHALRKEALIGVSAVAAKVMESRKYYDWERNHPAEHRPYIKQIDGKIRFMWLTTVVTFKDELSDGKNDYIAGSLPDVTLTDATYRQVIWLMPHQSSADWIPELKRQMDPVWEGNQ